MYYFEKRTYKSLKLLKFKTRFDKKKTRFKKQVSWPWQIIRITRNSVQCCCSVSHINRWYYMLLGWQNKKLNIVKVIERFSKSPEDISYFIHVTANVTDVVLCCRSELWRYEYVPAVKSKLEKGESLSSYPKTMWQRKRKGVTLPRDRSNQLPVSNY